jgi:hypothetical protein
MGDAGSLVYVGFVDRFQSSGVERDVFDRPLRARLVATFGVLDILPPASKSEETRVRIKRHEFRWVFYCGLIFSVGLGVGCSDDGKAPTAESTGSRANTSSSSTPSTPTPSTKPPTPSPSPTAVREEASEPSSVQALVEGGRSVYNANCIACHSMDPTKDGALGPAVSGSSLALLETRVLRGEYPEGYEPKRTTRVMIPLPHLEPRLAELVAYLNSSE